MKLVALETSSEICSLAYLEEGRLKACVEELIPRRHAECLPRFCQRLIKETGLELKALDGIAVSIGPGSFTGLRVGLSFAKGLAFSQGLPLVPVPTLGALAYRQGPFSGLGKGMLFSHRKIIFHQDFTWQKRRIVFHSRPQAQSWKTVHPTLERYALLLHWGCQDLTPEVTMTAVQPSAAAVGSLAEEHYREWVNRAPYDLVPEYISPFENESQRKS